MNTGIYTMPGDVYHGDPAEVPSLSSSIAHLLCSSSPAHARAAHPKLNPDHARVDKAIYDTGTVAHSLLLEGRIDTVHVVNADNWRTKAAQESRDEARASGKVPILAKDWPAIQAMCNAAAKQIGNHEAQPPLFTDGEPEQTLVWEEAGGVVCRARLDWLRDDKAAIDDLKTTSRSANPEAYSRALFGVGGDVQAAFYIRGVEKITGCTPEFRWCVVETTPPYALSVVSPGPDVLTIGHKKVGWAIETWRKCLRDDHWPAYPTEVCYAELPPWEEARWLARELQEAA